MFANIINGDIMEIRNKTFLKIMLASIVVITLIISSTIATNYEFIHGATEEMVYYNRVLSIVGIPVYIFYLYLLYRMRFIKVFKILFYIGLVLSMLSLFYNLFLFDAAAYMNYGTDWNNASFLYVVTYMGLGFMSFLNRESKLVKFYFIFTFLTFFLFSWFPNSMFGSNLIVPLYLEMSESQLGFYYLVSLINIVIFILFIDEHNIKIEKENELSNNEKKDFNYFMKNK